MTRQEDITKVLTAITGEVPEIRSAVLASRDGLAIAGTSDSADNSRVAAMAATVQALGARVSSTTGLGALEETVIRGEETTFVVYDAGEPAVLAVQADAAGNLGLVHLEGRRAAALLAGLLTRAETPATVPPPPPPPAGRHLPESNRVPVGAAVSAAVSTNGATATNGTTATNGAVEPPPADGPSTDAASTDPTAT